VKHDDPLPELNSVEGWAFRLQHNFDTSVTGRAAQRADELLAEGDT
jgi:hypothetical protein